MKRAINNAKDYELILKDRLGNAISKPFLIKKGKNELEINAKKQYYQSLEGIKFFIYEGDGILDFENECIKEYDFERLNFHFLNTFLGSGKHHKAADQNDIKIINDFLALLEFNEKNHNKIKPLYYERITNKLFGGKNA